VYKKRPSREPGGQWERMGKGRNPHCGTSRYMPPKRPSAQTPPASTARRCGPANCALLQRLSRLAAAVKAIVNPEALTQPVAAGPTEWERRKGAEMHSGAGRSGTERQRRSRIRKLSMRTQVCHDPQPRASIEYIRIRIKRHATDRSRAPESQRHSRTAWMHAGRMRYTPARSRLGSFRKTGIRSTQAPLPQEQGATRPKNLWKYLEIGGSGPGRGKG